MKIRPLLFNIISLQGNALSAALFELSYPFKIEGIFLVKEPYQENMGDEEEFHIHIQ